MVSKKNVKLKEVRLVDLKNALKRKNKEDEIRLRKLSKYKNQYERYSKSIVESRVQVQELVKKLEDQKKCFENSKLEVKNIENQHKKKGKKTKNHIWSVAFFCFF